MVRRSRCLIQKALVTILCSGAFSVCAQLPSASPPPDYSNVDDILDGRRTLVAVNDLVIGGLVLKTSSGTKINPNDIYRLSDYNPKGAGPQALVRMFDSMRDVLVYTNGQTVYATDPVTQKTTSLRLDVGANEFDVAAIATGRFKGDGFDQVVIASASGVRIVSAIDPNDFSKGLYSGPPWKPAAYRGRNSNLSVAVGDFLGDGHHEVAISWGNTDLNKGLLNILTVDPKTFALGAISEHLLVFHGANYYYYGSLAAGRFGSTSHDQLVAAVYAFKSNEPQQRISIRSFDFDSNLRPIQKDAITTGLPAGGEVLLKTGHFDPTSPYEQTAIKWNPNPGNVQVGILSFDNALKIRYPTSLFKLPNITCSSGLTVGNFDRTEPVPQDPTKTQLSFKLQLAVSSSDCRGSIAAEIYNVDPPKSPGQDFTIAQALGGTIPNQGQYYGLPIAAGDIQGRSYILGEPTKVVISDTDQPSVIAAMPPMHVDFIPPVGKKDPTVLNLSAIPEGFYTTYETTSSEKFESSTTNTTSLGFGASQKVGAEVEIGSVENGFGAKASASVRAAQDLKSISEKEHGSYQSYDFTAKVSTGFADKVWFTETRFNIYIYPVIGRTVCPAAKQNCQKSEEKPLTVQFSGPDHTSDEDAAGNIIPWYQPPWEPGNVLSYPATYAQLQQMVPNIDKLSADRAWRTDDSEGTVETKWATEETNGSSTSFDQNYSFESELSVAGACCGGIVTGTVSAELSLSGSTGFTDLNKAVATVGKSSGIGVTKPGTFLVPTNYNYSVTPYIFGELEPPAKVDNPPLDADIKTSGILRTAFVADPLRRDAGGWWKQAYSSAPDVALNHPSRWTFQSRGLETPIPDNCRQGVRGGSTMSCMTFATSLPNNPWNSLFHIMRGFFISSAVNPGKGPQLTTAKAGDKLTLEARVYNYSFARMPAGADVHVRFYVQPWDHDTHRAIGDSVLINNADVVLGPIPPFSDDDGAPLNWVLARTTFDTTLYENQYLVFWVVVWMQDSSGKLIPEIASHGLKRIPGTLKSIADVKSENYSNNAGFYNSEFFVFPMEPTLQESSLSGEPASIDVGKIQLSASRVLAGELIDVSALLSATNNSASGVTAVFYDGDPHEGGTAFGLERSPYIAENGTYQVKAPYQANTCGTHQLFIVVYKGTPEEILRRAPPVIVDCAAGFKMGGQP